MRKRAAIVGLLLAACGGPAQLRYEKQLEHAPAAAAHAVHEQRLGELMASLDELRNERLPKALDVEVEQERQTREVVRVARAMADSAARIPAAAPADLDERERAEFLGLANTLEQRTERLIADAPRLTSEQRRTQLAEIDATCDDCHRRFRIPGRGDVAR
jgi:cytochrome c556